jgi:hypothetical protein
MEPKVLDRNRAAATTSGRRRDDERPNAVADF